MFGLKLNEYDKFSPTWSYVSWYQQDATSSGFHKSQDIKKSQDVRNHQDYKHLM